MRDGFDCLVSWTIQLHGGLVSALQPPGTSDEMVFSFFCFLLLLLQKKKKTFCAISYVSISPKRLYYPAFFQSFCLYFLLYL